MDEAVFISVVRRRLKIKPKDLSDDELQVLVAALRPRSTEPRVGPSGATDIITDVAADDAGDGGLDVQRLAEFVEQGPSSLHATPTHEDEHEQEDDGAGVSVTARSDASTSSIDVDAILRQAEAGAEQDAFKGEGGDATTSTAASHVERAEEAAVMINVLQSRVRELEVRTTNQKLFRFRPLPPPQKKWHYRLVNRFMHQVV